MTIARTTLAAFTALTLAGCANGGSMTPQTQQAIGAALGGVAGGALGAQFGEGSGKTAAAIAGALGGALLGGMLADGLLTRQDTYTAQNTAQQAVNTSAPQTWQSQNGQVTGQVVPEQGYYTNTAGQTCRNYKQTIYVEGEQYETATGTACRQIDGTWRIVS